MTTTTSPLQELTVQILALPPSDRLILMQAIMRSLQTEMAVQAPTPNPTDHSAGAGIADVIDSDSKTNHSVGDEAGSETGDRHPLLVMLESLDNLDEELPEITDDDLLPLDDICLQVNRVPSIHARHQHPR